MTEPFGGEPFKSSLLLVLCNRLLTATVAAIILVVSLIHIAVIIVIANTLTKVLHICCVLSPHRWVCFRLLHGLLPRSCHTLGYGKTRS